MIVVYLVLLVILCVALAKSADWVVKSASYLARGLGVGSFLFGFLLLGFATTVPEMLVAFQSVREGVPQLSVGNLLGGTILLLSFIMGLSAIALKRIVLDHGMTDRDIVLSTLVAMAPAVVLWDGVLTRLEGVILVGIYLVHVIVIDREQHMARHMERHARHVRHVGHALALMVGGLAGLAISARLLVWLARTIAAMLGLSPFVVGLIVVTFGTNLPELALAWEAVVTKRRDIAFGDILGSAVINTPILGIMCIVSPFTLVDHERMRLTMVMLAVVAGFFLWSASSKRDITRREGMGLLFAYLLFLLVEVTAK